MPVIRPVALVLSCVLALALLLTDFGLARATFDGVSLGPATAEAQERKQRPNLLDVFRKKKAKPQRKRATKRAKRPSRKRAVRRAAKPVRKRTVRRKAAPARRAPKSVVRRAAPKVAATLAPEAPAEKIENAKTVLVVGDFLADGLADGLSVAFADSPGVEVVGAANGASGLVRDDYYDWSEALPELIEAHEPTALVVQLGANDRQPIKQGGETHPKGSAAWNAAYIERIDEIAGLAKNANVPLVWVGTPAFRQRSLTADMATYNGLYEAAAERVGGTFVDIWDGFVDQNGAYVRSGPDINGQVVRLRGKDGINLSRAGKRKMAFFAEKELRRILGGATAPTIGTLGIADLPPLGGDLMEAPLQPRMTPPISLNDPSFAGSATLLGEGSPIEPIATGPAPRRVNDALAGPDGPPAGRADDFSWPPSG